MHPVALGPHNLSISTDWVGPFRIELERLAGGFAIELTGALGDINPLPQAGKPDNTYEVWASPEETDQLVGFSMGADDYVTKPFSVKVLLQRIKALQRRLEGTAEASDVVEHLGVRIDRVRHRALVEGHEVDLTPTEFRLLECLLRQPGRAFTRPQLLDAAIGDGAIVLERTIDVHIKTLRRKLDTGDLIETVRGVGYRFRERLPEE